jgi:hypothetical protein
MESAKSQNDRAVPSICDVDGESHDSAGQRKEAVMDWARILTYVTGTVDQELLARNEYLAIENRILKDQLKADLFSRTHRRSLHPHRRQPRARVSAARSSSRRRRKAWNLGSSNAVWHIGGSLFVLAD